MENSDYVINVENDKRENLSNKISASVKKALRIKMEKGSSIASRPPYGYFFNEVYKNGEKFIQLVPRGDETSEVVKRSEEHTSELQSRQYLVCRLLLEKKNSCARLSSGFDLRVAFVFDELLQDIDQTALDPVRPGQGMVEVGQGCQRLIVPGQGHDVVRVVDTVGAVSHAEVGVGGELGVAGGRAGQGIDADLRLAGRIPGGLGLDQPEGQGG